MSKICIFNPEHDLALAFGGTNYTPPPMARLLQRDLQMLPIWISEDKDFIFTQNPEIDSIWLEQLKSHYDLNNEITSSKDITAFDKIEAWGWNRFLWHRLKLAGVKTSALPTENDIENIRNLSHRRISIKIHQYFLQELPFLQNNIPIELNSIDKIKDFARLYPKAYVKAPWSSSGKGIYRALDIEALDFNRWCSGILKRQGSLLCEKPLNAILDFAMEFCLKNGKTKFIGYSIFNNDSHCSFNGGLLMPTEQLQQKIETTLGNKELLFQVKECAIKILDKLVAPFYNGYAGMDMMIYRDNYNSMQLNPCIELNLRTTMGIVSSIIGNRFLADGASGTFNVEFHKSIISENYRIEMEQKHPLIISNDGKIKSGVQFLTPLYPDSQYCAYITVS